MVQSDAPDVASYIAEATPERAPYLQRLRDLCLAELDGFQEQMGSGMPVYTREGKPEVAFANQKQYISLYIMNVEAALKNAEALAGMDFGKSCLRFRKPATIDFALVERLLRDTKAALPASC